MIEAIALAGIDSGCSIFLLGITMRRRTFGTVEENDDAIDDMDMPCICDGCGEWFELNEGRVPRRDRFKKKARFIARTAHNERMMRKNSHELN